MPTAPVNVAPLSLAKLVFTKAVVATFVVASPAVGVGARGETPNDRIRVARVAMKILPRETPASSYALTVKSEPAFDPASATLFANSAHRIEVPVL
jgi:hypothetical protein